MGKPRWGEDGKFLGKKYIKAIEMIQESEPDIVLQGARKGCFKCRNHPGVLGYNREQEMVVICPCIFADIKEYNKCFPRNFNRKILRAMRIYRRTNKLSKQLKEKKL